MKGKTYNSVRNNESSLYTGFVIYGTRYTEGICAGFGKIQGANYSRVSYYRDSTVD